MARMPPMTFESVESVYDPSRDDCSIDLFLICRSGFLQHKGSPHSGMVKVAGMLDYHFGCARFSRSHGRNVRTRVEMEAWNDCPEATAEYIYRLGTKDTKPRIGYFGYSWGCGYGFVQLAKELQRRGLEIDHAVLCDPVFHGLFKWRAMIPSTLFHKIYVAVPGNVNRVSRFFQRVDKPAGHDLKLLGPYTRIVKDVELKVGHCDMDDHADFHRECFEVAARLAQ